MSSWKKGPIAWMAKNSVASNLLMLALMIGGLITFKGVKQEVFPEFELDIVNVSVPYPGASPAEVEEGIILVLEEAVRGLDGVKQVTSRAGENMERHSRTPIGLRHAENGLRYQECGGSDSELSGRCRATHCSADFPPQRGDFHRVAWRGSPGCSEGIGRGYRTDLQNYKEITQVGIDGVITDEISIEIDKETLRAHGLSLRGVAETIRASSPELPAEESRHRKVKFCFGPTSESESDRSSSPSKSFRVPMDKR